MVSQLSLSSPPLLPSLLFFCLCHHLRVRNWIKLPPSNSGICVDGHIHAHTCTLGPALAAECTSQPSSFLLSSTLPDLFTSSFMLAHCLHLSSACLCLYLFLCSLCMPPFSHILTMCHHRLKTRITHGPDLKFVLVRHRSLSTRSTEGQYNNL